MALVVKEVFRTLQGEGFHSGTPSVFVRLAGCNMWSGHEKDRARDAAKNWATCPLFCDTDFVGGDKLEPEELASRIWALASQGSSSPIQHVVFTGGEPALQLNRCPWLLEKVRGCWPRGQVTLALETNGTVRLREELVDRSWYGKKGSLDWICVSPKLPASEIKVEKGDELKVVYPAYDPLEFEELGKHFNHLLVQPEAPSSPGSLVARDTLARAVTFCLENPSWRLSLQTHKYLEIP